MRRHTNISVTIELTVTRDQERRLRERAQRHMLECQHSAEEADEYLDPDEKSLGDCAQIILDIGSGDGDFDIENSSNEESIEDGGPMPKEHTVVVAEYGADIEGVEAGTVGTVVHVYANGECGEVEFEGVGVRKVSADQIDYAD